MPKHFYTYTFRVNNFYVLGTLKTRASLSEQWLIIAVDVLNETTSFFWLLKSDLVDKNTIVALTCETRVANASF